MTRMSLDEYPAGIVDLEERVQKDAGADFSTIPVVAALMVEDITFSVRFDTDEGSGIAVEISTNQVGNGKDRSFYMRTEAHLDWDAVRRVHAFLGALIAVRGTVECEVPR